MQEALTLRTSIFGQEDVLILQQIEEIARLSYNLENFEICLQNYGKIRHIMRNNTSSHKKDYIGILERMALICKETGEMRTALNYISEIQDIYNQNQYKDIIEPIHKARTSVL